MRNTVRHYFKVANTLIIFSLFFLSFGSISETAAEAQDPFAFKTTSNVYLRAGPGTGHDKIVSLSSGTRVIELEREDDWSRVIAGGTSNHPDQRIRNGFLYGWVHNNFVERADLSPTRNMITKDFIDLATAPENRTFFCATQQNFKSNGNIFILIPLENTTNLEKIVSRKYKYRIELHTIQPLEFSAMLKFDPRLLIGNSQTQVFSGFVTLNKFGNVIRINADDSDGEKSYPWGVIRIGDSDGRINLESDISKNKALEDIKCNVWQNSPRFRKFSSKETDWFLVCNIQLKGYDGTRSVALSAESNMLALPLGAGFGSVPPVKGSVQIYDNISIDELDYDSIDRTPADRELPMELISGHADLSFIAVINGVDYSLMKAFLFGCMQTEEL